jgi:hypothetical protein
MQYELWYDSIENESDSISNYTYYVDENLKDVIAFLYKKHFGKEYIELGWWLEPGAKEFVKDIEDKWFHNKIDTLTLYTDYEFIDFLKQVYYDDAVEQAVNSGDLKDYTTEEPDQDDFDDFDDYLEAKKIYDECNWDN